jgi:hypothetical protein
MEYRSTSNAGLYAAAASGPVGTTGDAAGLRRTLS